MASGEATKSAPPDPAGPAHEPAGGGHRSGRGRPGGIGVPAFWDLLTAGRTATRGITLFDPAGFRSRIAAECDFDPRAAGLGPEQAETADRYIQFALAAAREAVADSGLDLTALDPWRTGASLGSAVGGTTRLERDYVMVSGKGSNWEVSAADAGPHLHRAFQPSALASEVAEDLGAMGPVQTVSTGCTSGLDAVGHAFHLVQEGKADIMVAGAADSPISRSRWPASTRSRPPRPATTTRRTPPARSTPNGTASCSARAAPSCCWRSGSTPAAGAPGSTASCAASPPTATRTT